jgi:cellulose synthase (UDP-forming)
MSSTTGTTSAKGRRLGTFLDSRTKVLRVLSVTALAWGLAYLTWRVAFSFEGVNLMLGLALLVTELYGWLNLVGLAWFSWDRTESTAPVIGEVARGLSVDVVVCTYDEPEEILRATLTGVSGLTYPARAYVLDDGRRPWVKELSERYGATWVTRPDNSHAKAGNINHALAEVLTGDLVLVLDADHVPVPDALERVVGYFEDPALALVQSPHDFFNFDSVQHYGPGRHDQSVFFEVIMPGKSRHGAAFWCGSASLIRRQALLDVGGVAVETIAEDFHTTIKMHALGWKSTYHSEVLVQGLGPLDLDGYLLQRDRWARGNLDVFATPESPLRSRGLSVRQRLSNLVTLVAYMAGPVRLLQVALIILTLATAALPMKATALVLAALWAPWTVLSTAAGIGLCRGRMTGKESAHYELLTAEIHVKALWSVITRRKGKFKVTPKRLEGMSGGWGQVKNLKWLLALSSLLVVALLARGVDEVLELTTDLSILPDLSLLALVLLPALGVYELSLVVSTLRKVAKRRQRRADYRFTLPVIGASVVGSWSGDADITDLSTSGAALVVDGAVEVGSDLLVRAALPTGASSADVFSGVLKVRNCWKSGERWHVGGELEPATEEDKAVLYRCCFLVGALGRLELSVLSTPAPAASTPVLPLQGAPRGAQESGLEVTASEAQTALNPA